MAIEVGDAVLKFLGDSTNLDTQFDQVGPKAQKAFEPAAEAAEDAGSRMTYSMGEARGEVALLGEELGIRLPRHVRSFVAELPGLGKALSAAFSATAVLFVAQAAGELGKKLSETLAEFIYAKSVMEESEASVVSLNNQLTELGKEYEQLKKQADDYGKSTLQLATEHKGEVKESVEQLTKTLHDEEEQFKNLIKEENEHTKTRLGAAAAWDAWKSGNLGALQALKAFIVGIDTSIVKHKEHDEIENKLLITNEKLKVKQQELRVATNGVATAQDELNKKGKALEEQIAKAANQINEFNRQLNRTKREASEVEIITPSQVQNMLKGIAAAHGFGITLKSDLVGALMDAKKAQDDFMKSGIQDGLVQKQLADEIDKARKALDNYGKTIDTFQVKSHGLWKQFRDDAKAGATAMDHVKQIGVTAFDDLTAGMQQAIAAAILSQGSFAQALEKATASALASIASQALVKSLFYTAEGFAALAGFEEQSASEYFSAAGLMAAVGAAAGLAAYGLNGAGGGGSGSTQQGHNSVSNTGQSNRSAIPVGFATGGLVTGPTLAMIGEDRTRPREAVLPLDDPHAKRQIGEALGGSGTTHHWHIDGVISADNLAKVVGKINSMVHKGQVHLTASNSMRVTKRSA